MKFLKLIINMSKIKLIKIASLNGNKFYNYFILGTLLTSFIIFGTLFINYYYYFSIG